MSRRGPTEAPLFTPPSTSYDDVLYLGHVQPQTHPSALAAMARLYGLEAPPPERARVLELGCGAAANLLSIAATLPGSECVGLDLAARPIADGRALAAEAGLGNVRLEVGSVAEATEDLGRFDYIIAHGLYSWVPPAVAEAVLDLAAQHLAPEGLFYLSYNTYPGWHSKRMIRELMAYHVRDMPDPAMRVEQGRALIMLLATHTVDQGAYRAVLHEEAEELRKGEPWYLLHDHLGAENHPVYYHELAARAAARGLRRFAPANFHAWESNLDPEVEAILDSLPDPDRREQYLDFFGNRAFRRDLFCRAGRPHADRPSAEALAGLYVTSLAQPENPEPAAGEAEETFKAVWGAELTTGNPLVKAVLRTLAEALPRSLGVDELRAAVADRLGPNGAEAIDDLGPALLQCARTRLVSLDVARFALADAVGDRPRASGLARAIARQFDWAPNLRHEVVRLGDLDRLLLTLLDGSLDREALLRAIGAAVAEGRAELRGPDGRPIDDPDRALELVVGSLDPCLRRLAAIALLTAPD